MLLLCWSCRVSWYLAQQQGCSAASSDSTTDSCAAGVLHARRGTSAADVRPAKSASSCLCKNQMSGSTPAPSLHKAAFASTTAAIS